MNDQELRDRVWAALVRAGARSALGVSALSVLSALCLGPVWMTVAASASARVLHHRLLAVEARLAAVERVPRRGDGAPTPEPARVPGVSPCASVTPEDAVVPAGRGYYVVRRLQLACVLGHTESMEPVRLAAVRRDGRRVGLRVEGLRPGNPLTVLGLRDGDVLMGVGGRSLRDDNEVLVAVEGALRRGRVAVTVLRGGRIRTMTYLVEG